VPKLYVIYARTYSPTNRLIDWLRMFARLSFELSLVIILNILHVFCNVRSASAYAFSHSSYAHTFTMRQYDSTKDEENFDKAARSQSLAISFFLTLLLPPSALECLARFFASFISFTSGTTFDPRLLLCHAKRLSKCFVIPEKTCPARKLILHPSTRSVMF